MTLPPFPLDDITLDLIQHSLDGSYEVDNDGKLTVVGADFNLSRLLDFLSGYDADKGIDTGRTIDGIPVFEYPDQVYSTHDAIRALVAEVKRLRR